MEITSRMYLIFKISEANKIDFNQVMEDGKNTLRTSVDKTKTFIKWDSEETKPSCLSNLTWKDGPYTYDEIIEILKNPEWMHDLDYTI